MLMGYFDDSGTHAGSAAMVMAGFIGTEEQWAKFTHDWQHVLMQFAVPHFHMAECEIGEGLFEGWSRAKRDSIVHDLRGAILDNGLFGIGAVISKKDWDELVTGEERDVLGDSQDVAFVHAIDLGTKAAKHKYAGHKIGFIFDEGNKTESKLRIIEVFDEHYKDEPEIVSITFAKVKDFPPLQAADMLAWETNRQAVNLLKNGPQAAVRPHFQRFLEENNLYGEILDREMIETEMKRRRQK